MSTIKRVLLSECYRVSIIECMLSSACYRVHAIECMLSSVCHGVFTVLPLCQANGRNKMMGKMPSVQLTNAIITLAWTCCWAEATVGLWRSVK